MSPDWPDCSERQIAPDWQHRQIDFDRQPQELDSRISFAWQMRQAPAALRSNQSSAWDDVVAACERPCVCNDQWIPMTDNLLELHCSKFPDHKPKEEAPAPPVLRDAITRALEEGCKKHVNIFLYGPTTSGKSHLLKPLIAIFKPSGHVFLRPVGKGNYPLQTIFGKKVCVLQDARVNTFRLSFDSLLVWWEGGGVSRPFAQESF